MRVEQRRLAAGVARARVEQQRDQELADLRGRAVVGVERDVHVEVGRDLARERRQRARSGGPTAASGQVAGAARGDLDDPVGAGVVEPAQGGVERLRRADVHGRERVAAGQRGVEHGRVLLGRRDRHPASVAAAGPRVKRGTLRRHDPAHRRSPGRSGIDELGPLWLQLHHHHARVSRVQPFVDDETSWAARRRSYVETFEQRRLRARRRGRRAAWWATRWCGSTRGRTTRGRSSDRYGEVWTVVVAEHARGARRRQRAARRGRRRARRARDPRPDDRRDGGQRRRRGACTSAAGSCPAGCSSTASRRPRDEGDALRDPGVAPGVRGRS